MLRQGSVLLDPVELAAPGLSPRQAHLLLRAGIDIELEPSEPRVKGTSTVSSIPSVSFFLLRRVRLSSSESISSMAMGFVLTAAILRSLSITLLSQRNFNRGTFANLCRVTFVRVPHRSMIMLLSFFACLTSMFAPVSDQWR